MNRELPDGTHTEDPIAYLNAWDKLTDPIVNALDLHLFAFNPGLSFYVGDVSESIDTPFALRLYKLITGEEYKA